MIIWANFMADFFVAENCGKSNATFNGHKIFKAKKTPEMER